jgi:hypothetical protein
MNGISRYESREGLGRAKQDARAESIWMCGAIVSTVQGTLMEMYGRQKVVLVSDIITTS